MKHAVAARVQTVGLVVVALFAFASRAQEHDVSEAPPVDAPAPAVDNDGDDDDDAGALADLQMGTFRVESASPQGKRLGVGLSLGYPTAITAKLMLRPEHAVDVSIGVFAGIAATEACVAAHADYLWHPLVIARASYRADVPLWEGTVLDERRSAGDRPPERPQAGGL